MYTIPEISAFKSYFVRDFNYAPAGDADNQDYVMDADISRAYAQAQINFNDALFPDGAAIAFMWLSAFYLVCDLQIGMKGITSQANFPINSKSAGGVSVSYSIPDRYSKDPFLSSFTQNGYGMKYLSLLIPRLIGNIQTVSGATTP